MLEKTILSHLLHNEIYIRKVLPYLKPEYFSDNADRLTFQLIDEHIQKYNEAPSKEALYIELSQRDGVGQEVFEQTKHSIHSLEHDDGTNLDWLLNTTEKFCQDKAIYNAMRESLSIIDGQSKKAKGSIPQLLIDALSISFDPSVGHDYMEDVEERFSAYHEKAVKIPFDLEYFNKITKGGVSKKTLSVIMGGTGVGKTLLMCHMAATNLSMGYNVLYITLEMGEKGDPSITQRIDANLLNVKADELMGIERDIYMAKWNEFAQGVTGRLIVKDYPGTFASAANFRALLNELRIKKQFIPNIIYIDYLNLCASSRMRRDGNMYEYVKSVAEEIRGMAQEYDVPIISATQMNREGYKSSDPKLENMSESSGTGFTADFIVAVTTNEQLNELQQYRVKQLKNRFGGVYPTSFVVGVDKPKMRLYDVEQSAQTELSDKPVMDTTPFGQTLEDENVGYEGFT